TTQLIDQNGNIDFNRVTTFSAADYAGLISYSRQSEIEGLSYGGNVKIVHRNVGDFADAWGFGFDLGAQYQKNQWTFAAMGRDVTTTFNAWSANLDEETEAVFEATGNEIPGNSVEITLPELVLAVNRAFVVNDRINFLAELNLVNTFDGKRNTILKSDPISMDPTLGFEASYDDLIFLRTEIGRAHV